MMELHKTGLIMHMVLPTEVQSVRKNSKMMGTTKMQRGVQAYAYSLVEANGNGNFLLILMLKLINGQ